MSNPYGNQQPYGRPPAPQGLPVPAAPIVWDDQGSPSSAPWSGPAAFAPAPAPAPAAQPPVSEPAAPAAPVQPPAAAPAEAKAPAESEAGAAEAPTAMSHAVDGAGTEQPAADDALTIGRGRGNSILLDDMLVSRQHVRITADDEGLVLEDLGSRNGTFVNGRRVERTHLHEGDHIGVGASTFEVRDGWLVTI
ncbi:FHA domain-containing protein [Leekyejoonella antrihumi]|uniref:FHA domain-containing protein n=1 Tax=Leekyejoonella antrihumi TaxID=1660198 RepID=A0A563DZ94_9MICO|nr:FHA domain-containing protein [Leekyejoonella antrihumi]TWP35283.1 FHA domain-containing protein [Leekyejoonella antrihumi]